VPLNTIKRSFDPRASSGSIVQNIMAGILFYHICYWPNKIVNLKNLKERGFKLREEKFHENMYYAIFIHFFSAKTRLALI
jgi:hypothetical protein